MFERARVDLEKCSGGDGYVLGSECATSGLLKGEFVGFGERGGRKL